MGLSFNEPAAAYDRWYETPLGRLVDTVEKQAIFDLAPQVQGRRILEVGCGTGNFSLELARRGAQVVGLDCSGPMLARAQAKARGQDLAVAWVRGRASRLPFANKGFDGVMCILALDFMSDREVVLQEMVRVLAPGGFLSVAILNRFSLWTLKRVIRAWFKPSLWREVRFLTPKELGRLLTGNKELVGIRSRRAVYFPPWANRRLVRYYPYLEHLGNRLNFAGGAFLAATARKKG
ncbi:MAG: hypothetical protein A2Y80_04190 [Deltaproteobacteria bacterium RBG_13_58_19]|nr:MAG: hypothetical protein A2Y80_04190 [Deltaproteobacteria bacterium RBG_13_58_19]